MPRNDLIQFRGGTSAQWADANPVLADREPGWDTEVKRLKVGDGTTAWGDLAWIDGDGGGSAVPAFALGVPITEGFDLLDAGGGLYYTNDTPATYGFAILPLEDGVLYEPDEQYISLYLAGLLVITANDGSVLPDIPVGAFTLSTGIPLDLAGAEWDQAAFEAEAAGFAGAGITVDVLGIGVFWGADTTTLPIMVSAGE